MTSSLGSRLREHRIRQQVDLRAIAAETKISESLLDALEHDDVSRWPGGIFRRAFVRAYAQAINLNPDEVVREFLERYPDPLENVDTVAAAAQATGTYGSPLGVIRWLRSSGKPTSAKTTTIIGPRADDGVDAPQIASEPARALPPRPAAIDPNVGELARLCTALGRVRDAVDARPLLDEVSRVLGAAGLLVWRWEPQRSVLHPSVGHGYSDAVIAQLPDVAAADDNAVAAAFRGASSHVVNGSNGLTGAVAVPILSSGECTGVLALEFRNGGEQLESVRAAAAILAAQLVHVVTHIR